MPDAGKILYYLAFVFILKLKNETKDNSLRHYNRFIRLSYY